MLRTIRHTLEMIRFSHTLFALPFALLAALMAWALNSQSPQGASFRWLDLLGILLCMVTARSAAMAFNRLADRKIDALNPRTVSRHLPAGTLSVTSVSLFTAICSLGFVLSTLLFLPRNVLPLLASVPVLLFLLGYSLPSVLRLWPICGWGLPWRWRRWQRGLWCVPTLPGHRSYWPLR